MTMCEVIWGKLCILGEFVLCVCNTNTHYDADDKDEREQQNNAFGGVTKDNFGGWGEEGSY